jgi:hypothetical protein
MEIMKQIFLMILQAIISAIQGGLSKASTKVSENLNQVADSGSKNGTAKKS